MKMSLATNNMRKLILGRGHVVIVDESDWIVVNATKWTYAKSTGVISKINNKTVYLHRLLLDAKCGQVVDHINGNHLDNRRLNLRLCTQSQNSKNQRKPKNNTSGYKGVQLDPRTGLTKRWRAAIKVNRKRIDLGRHETAVKAAIVYDRAAIQYFGEYANLNFMDKTKNDQTLPEEQQNGPSPQSPIRCL